MIIGNFPDSQSEPEKPGELNEKQKPNLPKVKAGNRETQRKDTNTESEEWSDADTKVHDQQWILEQISTSTLRSLISLIFMFGYVKTLLVQQRGSMTADEKKKTTKNREDGKSK